MKVVLKILVSAVVAFPAVLVNTNYDQYASVIVGSFYIMLVVLGVRVFKLTKLYNQLNELITFHGDLIVELTNDRMNQGTDDERLAFAEKIQQITKFYKLKHTSDNNDEMSQVRK